MAKHRIRITGAGIHGAPTSDNPTGEMPIGFEFDTNGDLPAGWKGRAVIVGEEPKEGSVLLTGEDEADDTEVGRARREIIGQARDHIDRLNAKHESDTQAIVARAERAEDELQRAKEQIEALTLKLAAFDHDGDGSPGGATGGGEAASADEIRAAVGLLDAKTDAHWTAAGLPAVDAVAELTGKTVTRDAIKAAAPDAKRPA